MLIIQASLQASNSSQISRTVMLCT